MRIADVLRNKGASVATITPETSVSGLLTELSVHNIGAMVVVSPDGVVGIVSERDIVRALQQRGADLLRLPVSEIMTTFVATCTPTDTVDSLSVLMTTKRVRHIPVMEDGRLTGIVSIGDVVKTRMEELEAPAGAAAGLHHPVADLRVEPAQRRDAAPDRHPTLARAFYDDPVTRGCCPTPDRGRKALHRLFAGLARHHFLPRGGSEVGMRDGDVGAATLWDPPGLARRHGSRSCAMAPEHAVGVAVPRAASVRSQELMEEESSRRSRTGT